MIAYRVTFECERTTLQLYAKITYFKPYFDYGNMDDRESTVKIQRKSKKIMCLGPRKTYIKLHSDSYSSFQDCFIKDLGMINTAQWHYIIHLKGILCRISRNISVNEADSKLYLARRLVIVCPKYSTFTSTLL